MESWNHGIMELGTEEISNQGIQGFMESWNQGSRIRDQGIQGMLRTHLKHSFNRTKGSKNIYNFSNRS